MCYNSVGFVITVCLCDADVLGGYNGTIFAYGQTSSGKTHTMEVGATFTVSLVL